MSKKYREWVSEQPCVVTQTVGANAPHHIKGYAYLFRNCKPAEGSPNKPSDLACISLNWALHNELHDNGWETFEKKHNISQLEEMVKMILKAEREGILKL